MLGGNYKEKLHPWYLATPLWPWHNMGKEAKKKSEGSRVQIQVSPDICVLSTMNYYQASPGVTYCKRYLPWFITSTIRSWLKKGGQKYWGQKRNLRNLYSLLLIGTLLWKIRRSMSEVSQNWQKFGSNLLKLKVMKSSPHFPRKIKQKSRQNSSFSIQWNGQAPRKTNQIEQNTGTKISLSSKISLKVLLGFAFRA